MRRSQIPAPRKHIGTIALRSWHFAHWHSALGTWHLALPLLSLSPFAFRPRPLQQFSRTCDRLCAADHPGELLHPSGVVQPCDRGDGPRTLDGLLDPEVRGARRRDLRKVSDAQYLKPRAQRPELLAHDRRNASTDAGIHLVENQGL